MEHKDSLKLASYNITATFFTDPKNADDPKMSMPQHWWKHRRLYFRDAILQVMPDAMALQELSPEQAIDLLEMLPEFKFVFFTQAATGDVQAGKIYNSKNQIRDNLLGKSSIGTPLIGIMYNNNVLEAVDRGMFWYNPRPFEVPTATDRAETDKGYGNMNTPRGPGYLRFRHRKTLFEFYFFTLHAPLSGGWQTRKDCFECEKRVISQIVGNAHWFSVGDRNMIPDGFFETYKALLSGKNVYDWMSAHHEGFVATWLGYLYEPKKFQNQVLIDGSLASTDTLDIGIGSLPSRGSAHYHCIIRDSKVELLGELNVNDNATREFLSDHSMLVADFTIPLT